MELRPGFGKDNKEEVKGKGRKKRMSSVEKRQKDGEGGLGARKEERRKGRKEGREGMEEGKGEGRGRKEAEAVKRILRKWR